MAFGTLGLAGAASVIIALVSASLPAEVRKDPVTDMVNYVRNGQVMADVRTVTEIVRYLFESEPPTATNLLEQHSATNRTVPTNIPLATPIAYPIAG
jgi:hypothetical protein